MGQSNVTIASPGMGSRQFRKSMRQSGLADLLPSLRETVYVGLSAGSMVMAPSIGEDLVGWTPPMGGHETLGGVVSTRWPGRLILRPSGGSGSTTARGPICRRVL